MKSILIITIILASVLAVAGCVTGGYGHYNGERSYRPDSLNAMTKADIISLSRAGISDSVIITMMDVSGSYFQLKAQDVIELKNAGVSDKVISAMMTPPPSHSEERSRVSYDYYPPYPWYGGYPYWYPWYPTFYFGFAARYPRFIYGGHGYFPRYGDSGFHSSHGVHSYGGSRSGGRRR